ncbi:MAG: DNA repair protein RadA [Flavobacteriales bacterium]|nr:MAG: DNA repair protein RadA [Flavobacteriales bacterium]
MAKSKTAFICQNCGTHHAQWQGKCHACHQWNTIVEEVVEKDAGNQPAWSRSRGAEGKKPKARSVNEIHVDKEARTLTGLEEFDRVLGGGIVPGSLILLGGEPGIGKSTLMLQLALHAQVGRVLYVSGEESEKQLKMRAERIGDARSECFILTETSTRNIQEQIDLVQPNLVVIDSIQTLYSDALDAAPGSVSQLRHCAAEFLQFSKTSNVPVILIGHITKDGNLAGPKILEHMVDAVLQFEGDRHHMYRLLRASKNRFGSTSELGIYEMVSSGLREVKNASEALLSRRGHALSGNAVASTLEGMRAMLIEVQALVSTAVYGTPQRSTTGFDTRRLNMLLAVLEKRCGFRLASKDVFLNITGGIRVDDPAIDLGVVAAILSSSEDIPLDSVTCLAGEVGLSGEIRPVTRLEQRINEAEKMGFERIIVSGHGPLDKTNSGIQIIRCNRIEEVFKQLFG